MFVVGAVYGAIALAASVGIGALVMNGFGIDPQLADSATWALVGRSVLAMALWATIGVGLGVLVPNQVATIVIVLAFTQFVEPLLAPRLLVHRGHGRHRPVPAGCRLRRPGRRQLLHRRERAEQLGRVTRVVAGRARAAGLCRGGRHRRLLLQLEEGRHLGRRV